MTTTPVPATDLRPSRVCILKPSSLGDIIHALPVLSALRAHWPPRLQLAAIALRFLAGPGALGRHVHIEQFRGEWCILPADAQTILPSARRPEGQFARLGVDAVAGERAWEVQGGFRLHIGPLAYHEFVELFPDTKGAKFLADAQAEVDLGVGADRGGHTGWTNSLAIKLAKLDDKSPDPAGGQCLRSAIDRARNLPSCSGMIRFAHTGFGAMRVNALPVVVA